MVLLRSCGAGIVARIFWWLKSAPAATSRTPIEVARLQIENQMRAEAAGYCPEALNIPRTEAKTSIGSQVTTVTETSQCMQDISQWVFLFLLELLMFQRFTNEPMWTLNCTSGYPMQLCATTVVHLTKILQDSWVAFKFGFLPLELVTKRDK